MISSLFLALYLLGYADATEVSTFLYLSGGALIVAELFLPTFGLAGFNGVLALLIGYSIHKGDSTLFGLPLGWDIWFGIAFAEFFLLVVFVRTYLKYKRQKPISGAESMIGQPANVLEWEGTTGLVRIQGETWEARATHEMTLTVNETVIVESIDGMVLNIRAG